jgi:acetyl-CoA carboxylase biotin carboxyl carrier protein
MATEVYAPMVGKVIELLVQPGGEVEEDEELLNIEALKMKIPVVAPCDGTLVEFRVQVGDEVESDTVLAIIEED